MTMQLCPITLREARRFVDDHHRHHRAPQGGRFSIAAIDGDVVVGVVIVGRPVARNNDDGYTAEVTRLCVLDETPNACSMLYAAAWRACRAMGYRRLLTYTLAREPGTSLRAAGWREVGAIEGRSWNKPGRPRVDTHPIEQRTLWEAAA